MPFLKHGGLFLPATSLGHFSNTANVFKLMDSVCLLLQLPDDSQRHLCITKIAWITPSQSGSGRRRGIGVQFDRQAAYIRASIESKLGASHKDLSITQML